MNRLFVVTGTTVAALVTVLLFVAHNLADEHVRHVMGGPSAPVNCLSCHSYMKQDGFVKSLLEKQYLSPEDIAVSPDGNSLYVVAEEGEALLVVDARKGEVTKKIAVGRRPNSVVLSTDGGTAYVSNSWSNSISVIDLAEEKITGTLQAGIGPAGIALDRDSRFLYAANMYSDDISVIDLADGSEAKRLMAGNGPYAVQLSPDGALLYVTSRLTTTGFREVPVTEVTVVDAATGRIAERKPFQGANLLESVAFAPEGDLALVTLVRPKQLVPATQIGRGWMLTYGLGVIEQGGQNRTAQFLLDEVNAFFADPYDVVITPDGKKAFVTHAAADVISVVDLDALRGVLAAATPDSLAIYPNHLGVSSRYVIKRIPTGFNPQRLALSPDGRSLYVVERLQDRISVIDTDKLEPVGSIDLGGPRETTTLRLGSRKFHGARAFQGQFSCRTCHPDGDQDALAWDFGGDGLGKNIVNTMTLRDIGETSPFKWAGTNVSLYMQDGIRFAKHLTRVESFPPDELNAIVAYMYSIPAQPNPFVTSDAVGLTAAQERGKALFERTTTVDGEPLAPEGRCITCHLPPYYTNRQKFDVGTRRATDKEGMLFDTPQLVNIYETAPYLHDGSAATLEEIWTKNSVNDEHGVVSDFNKNQLNDLIEYLKTLRSPAYNN